MDDGRDELDEIEAEERKSQQGMTELFMKRFLVWRMLVTELFMKRFLVWMMLVKKRMSSQVCGGNWDCNQTGDR